MKFEYSLCDSYIEPPLQMLILNISFHLELYKTLQSQDKSKWSQHLEYILFVS